MYINLILITLLSTFANQYFANCNALTLHRMLMKTAHINKIHLHVYLCEGRTPDALDTAKINKHPNINSKLIRSLISTILTHDYSIYL